MGRRWLDVLSTAECQGYLALSSLGRVAVTVNALPVILPVFYIYRDGAIWFFTEEGTKLAAATISSVVAFEIDFCDQHGGWSVMVLGTSNEVVDMALVASVREEMSSPAALGPLDFLVCIPAQQISGRSFSFVESSVAADGFL